MRKLTLLVLIAVMALSGACATKDQETVATGAGSGRGDRRGAGLYRGRTFRSGPGARPWARARARWWATRWTMSRKNTPARSSGWTPRSTQTNNLNRRALAHNKAMEKKLAEMRFEGKRMRALARQNKLQAGQLAKEKAKLNAEQESTKALLAQVTKDVEKTSYILEKKKIKSDQQKQLLVASLKTMQERQQELETQLKVLAELPVNTM